MSNYSQNDASGSFSSEGADQVKQLLAEIVRTLPYHYNLTPHLDVVEKDARVSGGNCDIFYGIVPWTAIPFHCQSMYPSSTKSLAVAVRRPRVYTLSSMDAKKFTIFMKVRSLLTGNHPCKSCLTILQTESYTWTVDLVSTWPSEYSAFSWLRLRRPCFPILDYSLDEERHSKAMPSTTRNSVHDDAGETRNTVSMISRSSLNTWIHIQRSRVLYVGSNISMITG